MKEVIAKQRPMGGEPEVATKKCGIVSPAKKIPIKKKDPRAVVTPCTIQERMFKRVLIDSVSSVSLMPLSIFKKLDLEKISESETKLKFADHTIKKSYGVAEDVQVEVGTLTVKSFDEEVTLKMLEVKKQSASGYDPASVGMI
ncbi:uncharacterized protein LOC131613165 [Vicia villosa]|uniref:uncharacterized protein LOC131613165 n=1 Tax=Vicia villosa TaxID=3911 RepID=UPI00273C002C|nr:uncharacterized protein LOC131613165 [Vicia villosa]